MLPINNLTIVPLFYVLISWFDFLQSHTATIKIIIFIIGGYLYYKLFDRVT